MPQKVNYGDNIFFLAMHVKALQNVLKLEIDSELFSENLGNSVRFLAETIQKIYLSLKGSSLVLSREEYLKDIQRIMRQFVDLADDVINETTPMAFMFDPSKETLKKTRAQFIENIAEIRGKLSDLNEMSHDSSFTVSEEEYRHLLTEDE